MKMSVTKETQAPNVVHSTFSQRLVAEGLGTSLLLAAIVGSGIMAERLAAGNDAVALLANTFATSAMLVLLIMIFGPLSGAHFNPVVSFVMVLRKELTWNEFFAYIAVQFLGAIVGVMLAHIMFELPPISMSQNERSGLAKMISEFVATFGLIGVILGGIKQRKDAVPYLVAAYIGSAYWFTSSTSFANPAVTIARSLTDTFSGIRLLDAPGFIIAQLIAAVVAQRVFDWLFSTSAKS